MKKDRPEEKHSYLIDMKAHGSNCFHRLDSEGKEYIRKIPIPMGSGMSRAHQAYLDKKRKEVKRENNGTSE